MHLLAAPALRVSQAVSCWLLAASFPIGFVLIAFLVAELPALQETKNKRLQTVSVPCPHPQALKAQGSGSFEDLSGHNGENNSEISIPLI